MNDRPAAAAVLDGAFIPAPVPGVVAVSADPEAVLVDEVTDQLHLLNSTAALLWACFDGEASVAEICFDLADELGVPFELILADALGAVRVMKAQGALYDGRLAPPRRAFESDGGAHTSPAHDEVGIPRRPRLLEEPPNS